MIADRMRDIGPFHVMDILARARALEAEGRDVVHMEVGEPDFTTPAPMIAAAKRALDAGHTHYTPALGLPELRQAIRSHYARRYGVDLDWQTVAVTPGSSGALQLALSVLLNPGDRVLMADPGYPCNRHMVRMLNAEAVGVAVGPETAYQLTAALIERHLDERSRVVMLASPSNPTGTLIEGSELRAIIQLCESRGLYLLVDEIYHGLVYGEQPVSATQLSDSVFVINSFSKYFGMTGWRLGWLIAPPAFMDAIDRLAQNLFLAPSTPAQYAALAAFSEASLAILEQRREVFRQRRDFLAPALTELGFGVAVLPAGAFYLYADCSAFSDDSFALCRELLEQTCVAITPGLDFGEHRAAQHVRFAYTTGLERLQLGVNRLADQLS